MSIKRVYLGKIKDLSIWKQSSSGGVFWAFAAKVISDNGVCYGAKYNDSLKVEHGRAETLAEAKAFRGSKYVQSDMKASFNQVLKDLQEGKKVLFSGTPCQIKAMKNFIPDSLQENLLSIDILCHGVPSPRIYSDYVKLQSKLYKSEIETINFRGKRLKNSIQDMYIKFKSGTEYKSFGTQDIFYKFYSHEYISRPSCAKCKFTNLERPSDITISDYWGDSDRLPSEFGKMIGGGVYLAFS